MPSLLAVVLIAAPVGPAGASAAAARDALMREAAELFSTAAARGDDARYNKPYYELSWLYSGPGRVGRLHDLCTGAVEPKPELSIGTWAWDDLDPRTLSPDDRRKVLDWRVHQFGAGFACGTVFQIGTLESDARKLVKQCPREANGGPEVSPMRAFVAFVSRRPEVRGRDDLTETVGEALREAGCR